MFLIFSVASAYFWFSAIFTLVNASDNALAVFPEARYVIYMKFGIAIVLTITTLVIQ